MLKKISLVLLIVLVVVTAVVGAFYICFKSIAHSVKRQYESITPIDMRKVADGVYEGSFSNFLVSAKVAVTVKRHRITEIKILKQKCGPGYEALDIPNRIIRAQSPKVDAVTGASGSSMVIMIAVHRALTGK